MPESVLLEKILPGRKLSEEEWLSLIEERAALVRYSMDRVRLTKLCEYGYRPSQLGGGCTVSISGLRNQLTVVEDGTDIYVEGIFQSICAREETNPDQSSVLGFTRAGKWLVVDILEVSRNSHVFIDSIVVGQADLRDVVKRFRIDYRGILEFLSKEYGIWVDRKSEILVRMQWVQDKFSNDDRLIAAMCADNKKI